MDRILYGQDAVDPQKLTSCISGFGRELATSSPSHASLAISVCKAILVKHIQRKLRGANVPMI